MKRGLGLLLAFTISYTLWWLRPIPADPSALAVLDAPAETDGAASPLTVTQGRSTIELVATGTVPTKGLMFFQGALIDPRAYAKILAPIAHGGYLVVIMKAPYDLAIADIGGADSVMRAHPEVTWWAVGGHSLGGVAASTLAAGGPRKTPAVVLWASYPYSNLSGVDLHVLSVSGTADEQTTPDDIEASKAQLPVSTTYVAVPGATHASFGDYGEHPEDGAAEVSQDEAQAQIVEATLQWLNSASAVA